MPGNKVLTLDSENTHFWRANCACCSAVTSLILVQTGRFIEKPSTYTGNTCTGIKKKKRNETKILYELGHQTDHTMSQVFNIHVNVRGNDRKLKLV